jgi:hypothetical protein
MSNFEKLLRECPGLEDELKRVVRAHVSPSVSLLGVHRIFIQLLMRRGLSRDSYPLNQKTLAKRALRRWVANEMDRSYARR